MKPYKQSIKLTADELASHPVVLVTEDGQPITIRHICEGIFKVSADKDLAGLVICINNKVVDDLHIEPNVSIDYAIARFSASADFSLVLKEKGGNTKTRRLLRRPSKIEIANWLFSQFQDAIDIASDKDSLESAINVLRKYARTL